MKESVLLLALALVLAACGGPDAPAPATNEGGAASSPKSALLDADLDDAVGVNAAKAVEPGSEVTVYGRVRRTAKGVFVIVDAEAVHYCGELPGTHDTCPTPWDYCCEDPELVNSSSLVVEATDGAGEAVAKDALGIRPLDLVALRGRLERDDMGELVLLASSGWYRRERPVVGLDVRFP